MKQINAECQDKIRDILEREGLEARLIFYPKETKSD